MTAPSPTTAPPPADPQDQGTGGRDAPVSPHGRPPSLFWRYGFPAIMVVLVVLVPVLLFMGRDAVLHSTEGAVDEQVTDPAAPGWQALTEPTPTLLVLETDDGGELRGATLLSLASDESGSVIFVPATTSPALGQVPLSKTAADGPDAVLAAVEATLGAGIGDVTEVPTSAWTDLIAPVEPLMIDNPDDVYVTGANGQRTLQFPHGPLTLAAKDAAAYLEARNTNESDVNRLQRHEKFWQAWLQRVGTSDRDDAVPGERDSGLGRFVRALAVDRVEMASLPVQQVPIPQSTEALFLPIADQVRSLVARLVPFPIGSPLGSRLRIRLLDGTGRLDHGLVGAPVLVQANGQIDLIGNAPAFGVATTKLAYSDEGRRGEVDRLREALGVGELEKVSEPAGSTDVTITLGQDYFDRGTRTVPAGTPVTTGG